MSNQAQPGTGIVGTMRALDGRGAVRMEETYDTDVEDLWSALTQPERLCRWIGEVEGDLRLGGEFRARFTSSWEGSGRVDVCERPHRLVVTTWDEDGETVVEALLVAAGDRTHLMIEERGLPLEGVAAYGAGWQAHVEDLAAHLAGEEPGDWRTRWTQLRPEYAERAEALAEG